MKPKGELETELGALNVIYTLLDKKNNMKNSVKI
jgi:hypothetical protein